MTDTQKIKEAEQAWKDFANKRFNDIAAGTNGAIYGQFQLTAYKDFKSTLIQALENRVEEFEKVVDNRSDQFGLRHRIEQLKEVIKTVKELKP